MRYWFIGIILLAGSALSLQCAVSSSDLKGAMIQRIATFIEWPVCGSKNMTIGVYDDTQDAQRFQRVLQNQNIYGRGIGVKPFNTLSQLDTLLPCDILYVANLTSSERLKILQKLSGKGILMIGNTRDDSHAGVAVVLLEDGSRYKILINQDALKNANLRADYRLLKLAELVESN